MRCTPGARLALAFAFTLACAAAPSARADGPLGPGAPCKENVQDVVDAMSFDSGFAVAKGCTKLCKKAGATCAKHVNRAITCLQKSLVDSTFFSIKLCVDKPCVDKANADKKTGLADLKTQRDARLGDCDIKAQACAESENCSAP